MTVRFSTIDPKPSEDCFCSNPLDTGVVAHGTLHPVHLKCLQAWAKKSSTCPTCRREIDLHSIFLPEEIPVLQLNESHQMGEELPGLGRLVMDEIIILSGSVLGGALGSMALRPIQNHEATGLVALSLLVGSVAGAAFSRMATLPRNRFLVSAFASSFMITISIAILTAQTND
jgi:hypothetical protein